jgi:hypothetical protein
MSPVETTTRPLGHVDLDVDLDVEGVAARLLAQVTWPSVPVLVARFEGCRDDDVIDPRVQALAEIAPGPELVAALQAARDWELTDPERLFVVHLWERCAGWMQTLVAVATAEHARAICETIAFEEAEHAAGIQARLDAGEPWVLDDHCPRDVEDDVAAVTGHRGWAIGQRLRAGTALAEDGPLARTGHAVLQGRVAYTFAASLVEQVKDFTAVNATRVESRVLGKVQVRIDPGTGQVTFPAHDSSRDRIRRAALYVDADAARRRRQRATAARDVTVRAEPGTGMASVTAYLPAHEALACMNVLNLAAAGTRATDTANGDTPRAWGQARADHFVSILTTAGEEMAASGQAPTHHGRVRLAVNVLVDLPTVLGLANHPGEIRGYGPIDADLARELAADGTWQRWITEDTGRITDLGRTSYRPSQAIRDLMLANYPTCGHPGCRCAGQYAEIDHVQGWADGGATDLENLQILCKRHHQGKTHGTLTTHTLPDGGMRYRTRNGLHLTTEPAHADHATYLLQHEIDQPDDPPF